MTPEVATYTLPRDWWWLVGTLAFIGLWFVLWEAGKALSDLVRYAAAWLRPLFPPPPAGKPEEPAPAPKRRRFPKQVSGSSASSGER